MENSASMHLGNSKRNTKVNMEMRLHLCIIFIQVHATTTCARMYCLFYSFVLIPRISISNHNFTLMHIKNAYNFSTNK